MANIHGLFSFIADEEYHFQKLVTACDRVSVVGTSGDAAVYEEHSYLRKALPKAFVYVVEAPPSSFPGVRIG